MHFEFVAIIVFMSIKDKLNADHLYGQIFAYNLKSSLRDYLNQQRYKKVKVDCMKVQSLQKKQFAICSDT